MKVDIYIKIETLESIDVRVTEEETGEYSVLVIGLFSNPGLTIAFSMPALDRIVKRVSDIISGGEISGQHESNPTPPTSD